MVLLVVLVLLVLLLGSGLKVMRSKAAMLVFSPLGYMGSRDS